MDGHVLMLHTGRSGSTLLGDMLGQHPQVMWDGEVLEKLLHRMSRREGCGIDQLFGRLSVEQAIAEIVRRQRLLAGGRIYGIEIQDYHLDFFGLDVAGLIAALRPLGFTQFVVLDRKDQVRKVVSHIVALDRHTHHIHPGEQIRGGKVQIVPERVYVGHRFRTMAKVLKSYELFLVEARTELAQGNVLELDYETHVENNPHDGYRRICHSIGVEPREPNVNFGKTAPQPLSQIVANFDEMTAYLEARDLIAPHKHATEHAEGGDKPCEGS